MIKSFQHKGVERFFYDGDKRGIQAQHSQRIADILDRLDASVVVQDMSYPGSGLHRLKRDVEKSLERTSFGKLEKVGYPLSSS